MSKNIENIIKEYSQPLESEHDLDELINTVGNKKVVLIGEASHGTKEYYEWRMAITKRLIQEKKFSFVVVEGDWPDCYELNRYVKGYKGAERNADLVFRHAFKRWPTWMWANEETREFIEWLRQYNLDKKDEEKVGFYGLDVYSLWESMNVVMNYVKHSDPEAMEAAYNAYYCFENYSKDGNKNWFATSFVRQSCQDEVLNLLHQLQQNSPEKYADDREAHFNAEQNALVAKNAEEYYRSMIRADQNSWNVRERHMSETLDRLMHYYGDQSKVIVWAHNTHIGDARATPMAKDMEVSLGQLARELYGEENVSLIGFGSYQGSVIAGYSWGAPMMRINMPPAKKGSWEEVFHTVYTMHKKDEHAQAGSSDVVNAMTIVTHDAMAGNIQGLITMMGKLRGNKEIEEMRGHRAIGVVYNSQMEQGNYVPSNLPQRYDAFIYIDLTQALSPLPVGKVSFQSMPETFPVGE